MLLLFPSTHQVIKAEKILLAGRVRCQVIAVPKSISTECGLAIQIGAGQKDRIESMLSEKKMKYSIYEK
jgi:hypothetical protein